MMKTLALLLSFIFVTTSAWGKCIGFEDYRPSYCVKIDVKSDLEPYEDGCLFEYDLLAIRSAEPLKREYPLWKESFYNEAKPHYMKINKAECEEIKRAKVKELKGVSSQICYDTISYEIEFWGRLKRFFGIISIKPRFEFSQKTIVHFHDKGNVEVSCPLDF
ncbi:hypothetical protein ACLWBD_11690 [Bdellovibrio sp. HCB117]|uniref:hypothetical protein n=1 Tax=Bdellovibrio sp. HCB117 TaxID=3394359 RepID=UPI0039B46D36